MKQVEGALTPYEVYCFHCRVTFPVEARRCLHCGGPLFGRDERASASAASAAPVAPLPATADEADESPLLQVRLIGGAAIWVIVALAAVLQSLCHRAP